MLSVATPRTRLSLHPPGGGHVYGAGHGHLPGPPAECRAGAADRRPRPAARRRPPHRPAPDGRAPHVPPARPDGGGRAGGRPGGVDPDGERLRAADLARAVEVDRTLYEHQSMQPNQGWVALLRPTADLPLYLAQMRAPLAYDWHESGWRRTRASCATSSTGSGPKGPLQARAIPDTAQVPWSSSGWTGNQNVTQMLDHLKLTGVVAVSPPRREAAGVGPGRARLPRLRLAAGRASRGGVRRALPARTDRPRHRPRRLRGRGRRAGRGGGRQGRVAGRPRPGGPARRAVRGPHRAALAVRPAHPRPGARRGVLGASSTSSRCTSRPRSGAGATSRCRGQSTTTGSSASSTPAPTGRPAPSASTRSTRRAAGTPACGATSAARSPPSGCRRGRGVVEGFGPAGADVWIAGRPVDPALPMTVSPLREGAVVGLGGPVGLGVHDPDVGGVAEVRVVGGPDAGPGAPAAAGRVRARQRARRRGLRGRRQRRAPPGPAAGHPAGGALDPVRRTRRRPRLEGRALAEPRPLLPGQVDRGRHHPADGGPGRGAGRRAGAERRRRAGLQPAAAAAPGAGQRGHRDAGRADRTGRSGRSRCMASLAPVAHGRGHVRDHQVAHVPAVHAAQPGADAEQLADRAQAGQEVLPAADGRLQAGPGRGPQGGHRGGAGGSAGCAGTTRPTRRRCWSPRWARAGGCGSGGAGTPTACCCGSARPGCRRRSS